VTTAQPSLELQGEDLTSNQRRWTQLAEKL